LASTSALGDGTQFQATFTVADDADVGTHAVVITSPLGGAVIGLYVQRPAPIIASVSPGAAEVGTSVPLTITGAHLAGATLVVTSGSNAAGVTISNIATPDDATLTATLSVGSISPEAEPRLLIVATESGQATKEFFIVAAGAPSITGVRPGAGAPGTTTSVTLRGLNLTGAIVTTSSALVVPTNVVVVDDETITLDVGVSAVAPTNANHTITATVGLASAGATFRVIPANAPFIGAVSPPFAIRGATFTLVLDGVNLGNVTNVDLGGKITVSNISAPDASTVRAQVDVGSQASAGYRDVIVSTTTGSFLKSQSFRVNNPGQLPTITDVTPHEVEPGTTTAITIAGGNLARAGVTVGGSGVSVANVVASVDGTLITFDLTLTADAPAESRPVIVVSEDGVATCVVSSGADLQLTPARLLKAGSVFEVPTAGFRLFLFQFSINERFDGGLRTYGVSSPTPRLALSRLQAENVGRAVRDLPFGYVRVLAVTATNQIGTSDSFRFRR
jgi:hypothetical protein